LVATDAFRVEFAGRTQTLRVFINALAASHLPLFVRSVRVEPMPPEQTGASSNAAAPGPIVAQTSSKFAVVIEFVELLSTAGPATP
jgi:hypothetical protein